MLDKHHYLGAPKPVGERLWYAAIAPDDRWLGVLLFTAASRRLRHRDQWIGWSDEQRRRRLPLVVNNAHFLLLPDQTSPNLGSAVLSRVAARLSGDWMERYGHPVQVVETFVDPQRFRGTVYRAAGWVELGHTQGNQRVSRDYYEPHARPNHLQPYARISLPPATRTDNWRSLQKTKHHGLQSNPSPPTPPTAPPPWGPPSASCRTPPPSSSPSRTPSV